MILFRPLIRYADFHGRASRAEYWLFAFLQGFWYALLLGLGTLAMAHTDPERATTGVLIVLGVAGLSVAGLIIPNYAVLVRRLHDTGRGAIWLCLIVPSLLSTVAVIGTVITAVSAVGMGASREAFVGTALAGLGAAGLLGLAGMLGQAILTVLTLLPGARGENRFGPDPRDPSHLYDGSVNAYGDEARLDALFAEARQASRAADAAPTPAYAPAAPQAWGPTYGAATTPVFGRRRS